MNRTKRRPIPAGTISEDAALLFGIAISVLGMAELWAFTNIKAALLSFLTSFGYLFIYTPLKEG